MSARTAKPVYAVGIDLGTTYSCLAFLDPQGNPEICPNEEGQMSTPSVVMFDGDEIIVGSEALRNAVTQPERVVRNAKRFMGDTQKCWVADGHVYTPVDISALILRKLLNSAQTRLGAPIRHAVITVPAQFSDYQRQRTIDAGLKAGLERVDIINEPVAASLRYVLSDGAWFAELADEQTILVFDLGGGTLDLSLVKYRSQEVTVVASGGDLNLGGLDWTNAIERWACEEFLKQFPGKDPRLDLETMQALANDAEEAKRALSVRPRATVAVVHGGQRKTFGLTQEVFETLTKPQIQRCQEVTERLLRTHKMQVEGRESDNKAHVGWGHVDTVLVTGGATRMPMIHNWLREISGKTLNTRQSPDLTIAQGAALYAGMLHSGQNLAGSNLNKATTARLAKFKQTSVAARSLGILVREPETGERIPHYLIPADTPLPVSARQSFGTVSADQRRVSIKIVESGAGPDDPALEIGDCVIDQLPPDLPVATPIEVTIKYDEQARISVSARESISGKAARTAIVRTESVRHIPAEPRSLPQAKGAPLIKPAPRLASPVKTARPDANRPAAPSRKPLSQAGLKRLESSDQPILLCNKCAEPLDVKGRCVACLRRAGKVSAVPAVGRPGATARPSSTGKKPSSGPAQGDATETMEVVPSPPPRPKLRSRTSQDDPGADEFWNMMK